MNVIFFIQGHITFNENGGQPDNILLVQHYRELGILNTACIYTYLHCFKQSATHMCKLCILLILCHHDLKIYVLTDDTWVLISDPILHDNSTFQTQMEM